MRDGNKQRKECEIMTTKEVRAFQHLIANLKQMASIADAEAEHGGKLERIRASAYRDAAEKVEKLLKELNG